MRRDKRREHKLRETIQKNLGKYVVAATATAAVLGVTPTAQADIIYTGSDWGFSVSPENPPGSLPWQTIGSINMNVMGVNGFVASGGGFLNTWGGSARANLGLFGNVAFLHNGGPLAKGTEIGPNGPRVGSGIGLAANYVWKVWASVDPQWMTGTGWGVYHLWASGTGDDYIGLRFDLSGEYYYGWAEFSFQEGAPGPYVSGILDGYAYNTVPNQPILAGQNTGTPEPGTLGLLALGSLGLGFWRHRKANSMRDTAA